MTRAFGITRPVPSASLPNLLILTDRDGCAASLAVVASADAMMREVQRSGEGEA